MLTRWAVFVSGEGSNLQNILTLESEGELKSQSIELVVANKSCPAIEKAQRYSKNNVVVDFRNPEVWAELLEVLNQAKIDKIFLLGFMKIISSGFIRSWAKPIVNLHPSLLPQYKGLQAIERAFVAKEERMGVSLHEVVAELDSGPILKQAELWRIPGESLEVLTERFHKLEHKLVRDYLLDLDIRP
ncbi:MAG: phosphoribosylglycinamide formyltransferase [Deltaproteobacteria bacterium CG11_big_fil_rev_8_21_14_0_20_45_16]|nr:MAG: phosphoribosylglycinamide formyltransferase [Deltaproteobacteria bacterium CG11_big_fil_rev_8_21_14_0_20_45_16]